MAVNKAFILGNVGSDPEVRTLQGGSKVASFRVATTDKYKDRNNNVQEQTEWHNIVVWGKPADFVEQYVKKGSSVFVEGKITTRQWQDQQGNKRSATEIKCENIQLVGVKREKVERAERVDDSKAGQNVGGGYDEEDLAF